MRTRLAVKNTMASLLLELITALSGIILPRFFISVYGSSVNGLVSSIGQFITYMGLVEAGVSAAATVQLYKPLAEDDHKRIREIVSAAKGFYFKSGMLFVALDVILILGYPFIVKNEIADISFIRMMIVVLSLSGVIDYFILGKYRVLLVADQKTYIIAVVQSVGVIVTLFVSIAMIRMNCSPILVKSVVAVVYLFRTLYIVYYTKKHYSYLKLDSRYSSSAFPQRRSALFHQIVGMICNNTDIVLLTIMLRTGALVEVSVYSAYNMVAANITGLFNSVSRGISASFGELIAKGDKDSLEKSFSIFELLYFMAFFIIYTCVGALLYSFILLYSSSFTDAQIYPRWILVALFTACGLVQNIRIPGLTVLVAAGHFKQTQTAALLEAAINIGVSILLVGSLGINGVLIGTFAAYLYRSTQVIMYNAKSFLPGSLKTTVFRITRNFVLFAAVLAVYVKLIIPHIHSWATWVLYAFIITVSAAVLFLLMNYIAEPKTVKSCFGYVIGAVKR